jgi:ATP-binding protein involved in chromosome partitioning
MKDDFSIKGEIIDALSAIQDGGQSIVDTHMVEAVEVNGGVVDVTLVVGKERTREERFALEDKIYDATEKIAGVSEVKIKSMSPEALRQEQTGHHTHAPAAAAPAPGPKPVAPGARQATMPASAPVDGVGKIIAVASGKGGVGKSTVAVNLALALGKLGNRVGLLDVDIYGPSLPTLLGITERPGVRDKRIVPIEVHGLRVMSLGFLMEEDTPVIWRGPIVTGIIRQFLRDVDWSGLDYLVIDMPPGTGDAQLALAQTVPVDGAVVVTTPSELSLVDAARGVQMFKTLNVDVLGIVNNMSKFVTPDGAEHYIFGKGTVEREAKRLDTEIMGEIPLDTQIREGGDSGKPIMLLAPDSPSAKAFLALASRVVELKPLSGAPGEKQEPKKKGLFSFLKG